MKRVVLWSVVVLTLAAGVGCETTEEALKESGVPALNSNAIKALFSDKTVNGVNKKGTKWVIYYDPSGEVRGRAQWTGGSETDSGTWEATQDDMICLQFKKWRDGKLRCWQLYEHDGKLTWVGKKGPAETSEDDDTWREGNVENL